MKLSNLITEDLVKLTTEAETKEEIIEELVQQLAKKGKITDAEEFEQVILAREEKGSTGVGHGIAIPHGKSDVVKEPTVAFARSETGIDYDSLDGKVSKLFFIIAVPKSGADEHLKVLAKLSRNLMHDDFRAELLAAESKEKVLEIIGDYE